MPFPLCEVATNAIGDLRGAAGGHQLPKTPDGPRVTGRVLWTRDAYGSRFGVTAAFTTPDGTDRWYLWDIDACGHQAFTVHSGYYAGPAQGLTAWRAGVGELAAADATFATVDDPLLADLMPVEEGMLGPGGESVGQFAEYHRSKRLGEAVVEAVSPGRSAAPTDLDKTTAAVRFTIRRTKSVVLGGPRNSSRRARHGGNTDTARQADSTSNSIIVGSTWPASPPTRPARGSFSRCENPRTRQHVHRRSSVLLRKKSSAMTNARWHGRACRSGCRANVEPPRPNDLLARG